MKDGAGIKDVVAVLSEISIYCYVRVFRHCPNTNSLEALF